MVGGQKTIAILLALVAALIGLIAFVVLACKADSAGYGALFLIAWWAVAYFIARSSSRLANENAPPGARRNLRCLLVALALLIVAAAAGTYLGIERLSALATARVVPPKPIVWTQFYSGPDDLKPKLVARAIVSPGASCPSATVAGKPRAMAVRARGTNPQFRIKICEMVYDADQDGVTVAGVKLPAVKGTPKRIVVIGDTGCRIVYYEAPQNCSDVSMWPFRPIVAQIAKLDPAPDLVIHVGDYHYREAPCADRTGCDNSPFGDIWETWNEEFFKPAASLLPRAPWLLLRGNHEDCKRAGAGWNLLLSPQTGYRPEQPCTDDTDPYIVKFDQLVMAVFDTATAESEFGTAKRAGRYENYVRNIHPKLFGKTPTAETWLLLHQPLWLSYTGTTQGGIFHETDFFTRMDRQIAGFVDQELRTKLCEKHISPINGLRRWFAGKIPLQPPTLENWCNARPDQDTHAKLDPPKFSMVLAGDTHTFQWFMPKQPGHPVQLVAGMSGDNLQDADYDGAKLKLIDKEARLFGVTGRLWARHTFGFVVLDNPDGKGWTAKLHDVEGTVIVTCTLKPADRDQACK